MTASPVRFHSIMLGGDANALLDNHRIYCAQWGYTHEQHAIGSPRNSARTLRIYEYSVVFRALADAPEAALLVFADDDVAIIYTPLAAQVVIANAAHWIAENALTHRPEGCFFMLRAGPEATSKVEGILERLRTMPDAHTDRWAHPELEGISNRALERSRRMARRHFCRVPEHDAAPQRALVRRPGRAPPAHPA